MDSVQRHILNILRSRQGKSAKISRRQLREEVSSWSGRNVSDREMRQAIEELRTDNSDGAMICASLSGGYYTARDLVELDEALRSDESRIRKIAQRIRKQRQRAGLRAGQLELWR